ncbi:MAG TPA: sugar transferase [Solirubrobacteraceae bacterium]|nr:sugar transferase [Solirubrobacteraceae bacterium]
MPRPTRDRHRPAHAAGGPGGVQIATRRPGGGHHGRAIAIKYALERVIALLALLALAPVFLVLAAAVRLTSPGPAFYRQRRVGLEGRVFEMLKFRSMTGSASGGVRAIEPGLAPGGVEGEDRRTRVGRCLRAMSLDELPQLLNVVRGEMALVGPRPERPGYVLQYARCVPGYAERHRVKPGITGWAQVNGLRGRTPIDERVRCDNDYIEHWSVLLEGRILALTLVEVLRMRDRDGGSAAGLAPRAAARERRRRTAAEGLVVGVRLRPPSLGVPRTGVEAGSADGGLVGGLGTRAPARVGEELGGDLWRDL